MINLKVKVRVAVLLVEVGGKFVKLNKIIFGVISVVLLSCGQNQKNNVRNQIQNIVSDFQNHTYYSFAPYFKAGMSTILIDSTKSLRLRCLDNTVKKEKLFGELNSEEVLNAKSTFDFCKKHEIFGIARYKKFSVIETNLWDSTYTQLIEANSNYNDPELALYAVKNLKTANYKYSIVVLDRGSELSEINQLKDLKLIYFQDGVYLYRSFKNWDINKFDLLKCNW